MTFRLDGRRALVMGATRGIGYGIAKAFVDAGAVVAITGRKPEDAGDAAASLGKAAVGFALDTGDLGQIDSVHAGAELALGGGIDILVLNSGGPPPGSAMGVSSEMWQQHWNMMFVGLVRMADRALPGMIERKFGRILSVVSSGVIQPIPNLGMSNAIRPAIIGWGKSIANEVAKHGITTRVPQAAWARRRIRSAPMPWDAFRQGVTERRRNSPLQRSSLPATNHPSRQVRCCAWTAARFQASDISDNRLGKMLWL
jgi:NAD(P)-dependent dehydrogenase (short-subunit alcohol dehydrogenase family)